MATFDVRGALIEAPSPANSRDLTSIFTPVLRALSAAVSPGAWHLVGATDEPDFAGDWDNVGTTNAVAAFCTDGVFVYIKGSVIGDDGDIFTLPEGYRPSELLKFPTNKLDSTVKADLIAIDTDGTVALVGSGGAAVELYFGLLAFRVA